MAMTLAKYTLCKTMQLGHEQGLMQGTYISEANIESLKMHLVSDYRAQAQDSSFQQQSMEYLQLMGYFASLLQSYAIKNRDILREMCQYLNSHIGGSSSGHYPSQNQSAASSHPQYQHNLAPNDNQRELDDNPFVDDAQSEVFSVKQQHTNHFNSNQPQQSDARED